MVDLSFFLANLVKLFEGGFIPLVIALFIFTSMATWRRGRYILGQRLKEKALPVNRFIEQLEAERLHRVPGTGLFMTSVPDSTPPSLVHNVKHNHVMHENTILLTVVTESIPYVAESDQIEIKSVHPGIYSAMIRYGFMEMPDVPECLERSLGQFFPYDPQDVTYFLGRESLVSTKRPGMARWREHLFSFMTRNSQKATDFFKLPADQVFEIGIVVEL
jgi:KUP system potassium uptake protein